MTSTHTYITHKKTTLPQKVNKQNTYFPFYHFYNPHNQLIQKSLQTLISQKRNLQCTTIAKRYFFL